MEDWKKFLKPKLFKILETIFCKNASTENDVILDATGRDFISKSGLRTLNQTAIL